MSNEDTLSWHVKSTIRPGQPFVLVAGRHGAAKRFVVPQRFIATTTVAGVEVALTVETDEHGASHCVALELRQLDDGEPITGGTLRNLPAPTRLVREAVSTLAEEVQSRPGGNLTAAIPGFGHDDGGVAFEQNVRRPRRGVPITDEQLHDVARIYRAAHESGVPATEAVAREKHLARSTAARWVSKARERGILGPALPGQAGEADAGSGEWGR